MFTEILWKFVILETFVMRALWNCSYEHPQTQFCTSEFVLKMKFHKCINVPGLRMEIIRVLKGNVSELNILDNGYVNVETDTEYNFMDGKKYFIFGRNENGNIYSEMCKENTPLEIASHFYKRGLARFYKTGCDCINEMPKYTVDKDCHWDYSFLVRRGENCNWRNTKHFRYCQKGLASNPSTE